MYIMIPINYKINNVFKENVWKQCCYYIFCLTSVVFHDSFLWWYRFNKMNGNLIHNFVLCNLWLHGGVEFNNIASLQKDKWLESNHSRSHTGFSGYFCFLWSSNAGFVEHRREIRILFELGEKCIECDFSERTALQRFLAVMDQA